jgi:hypothetical protein
MPNNIVELAAEKMSPAVTKAVDRFHHKLAEQKVKEAIQDYDLAEKVRRVVEERDKLFHVASEMLATLMIEPNTEYVNPMLRSFCETVWKPQIEAIGAGRGNRALAGS